MKIKSNPFNVLLAARDTLNNIDGLIATQVNEALKKVLGLYEAAALEAKDGNDAMRAALEAFDDFETEIPDQFEPLVRLAEALRNIGAEESTGAEERH